MARDDDDLFGMLTAFEIGDDEECGLLASFLPRIRLPVINGLCKFFDMGFTARDTCA